MVGPVTGGGSGPVNTRVGLEVILISDMPEDFSTEHT